MNGSAGAALHMQLQENAKFFPQSGCGDYTPTIELHPLQQMVLVDFLIFANLEAKNNISP